MGGLKRADKMEFMRKRFVMIGGVLALLLSAAYLFFYGPRLSQLVRMKKECGGIERSLEQSRNDIATLKNLPLTKNLISEQAVPLAVDELTHLGKSKGLNFLSMNPQPITASGDGAYKTLPIEMVVNSGYSQLGEFLGALDKLEKGVVTVSGFKIAPEGGNSSKLKTELVLNLYLSSQ